MTSVNVTNARKDLYNLMDIAISNELVTITSKKGNVVMMSEENWEEIKETLYLLGDPEFMKDIIEARKALDSDFEAWN